MRKLTGLQWIIVLLTLATAAIHLYLGASNWSTTPTLAALWALDGVGYIVILALLYFSGRTGRGRSTMRWILILYTLLTLILYFVINGSGAFSDTLGLITKAIEALLIILLFLDRGSDKVAVPAEVAVAERSVEVRSPAVSAGNTAASTAAAAAATAAVASAKTKAEVVQPEVGEVPVASRAIDPATGMSREALMDYFGDIDSLSVEDWRAKLMGHLGLLGDTSAFDRPIEYIEGIGDVRGRKWRAINITKTIDLLVYGATRKGRAALAKRSGFGESEILTWANQVDLYRIKGVAKEYADLLEQSGVDTVIELAGRNPANLQKAMVEINEKRKLVRRTPNLSEVESWVSQAATLPRIMHY